MTRQEKIDRIAQRLHRARDDYLRNTADTQAYIRYLEAHMEWAKHVMIGR